MEGRLGRFLGTLTGVRSEEPQKVDLSDLRWGKRILASEIDNPQIVEELFQKEPVLGQTTLPFDGTVDMEIYQTRTMNDAIVERFSKPSEQEVSKDQLKLKEFAGV
jgi:hypothetical protein